MNSIGEYFHYRNCHNDQEACSQKMTEIRENMKVDLQDGTQDLYTETSKPCCKLNVPNFL